MNSLKKLLLIGVALASFSTLFYNLVWAPEWQVQRWPETRLRSAYIEAIVKQTLRAGDPSATATLNAIGSYGDDLEKTVFQRVLLSVAGTILAVGALNFLPLLAGWGKNERLRGSQLVSAAQLKRLVLWRRHRKSALIFNVYLIIGIGFTFYLALRTGSYFSLLAVFFMAGAFALVQYYNVGFTPPRAKIRLGGVPIPAELEGRHILIEGTTGSGKSQALYNLIADARARGDRGLVMDIAGACAKRFKKKTDLRLAFGESDSLKWNPFLEIRTAFDYAELARAAIPEGVGSAKGWHENARLLFQTVLQKLYETGEHSIEKLLYYVNSAPIEELSPFLQGTKAENYGQKGNEVVLQNTRTFTVTYLQSWSFLPEGGNFSIREWVRSRTPGQWLFIQYRDDQIAAIRQLLACWLQLAITETLSLDEEKTLPTWFVADEFDSLGALSSAKDALTKLRRYNGRCVFGIQSVAQPQATYGREIAQVLFSCLSTKLYLRAGDTDTAEYCSKSLGDEELLRSEASRSRKGLFGLGGDPSRSSADRHVLHKIVLPSELEHLPDLQGYLSIAGDYPIAKVKIPIYRG